MKAKDQICLEECYNLILEKLEVRNIIQKFSDEVLISYKLTAKGYFNCAWVTNMFCQWYEETFKTSCKAIYFVWPTEKSISILKQKGILADSYNNNGISHIAPVVDNTIVDFAFGQFDKSSAKKATVTPLSDWENRYSKYGYGTNQYEGQSVYVDEYKKLKAWQDAHDIESESIAAYIEAHG